MADAGPDIIITLPQHTVTLNGSGSHDGFGIREYQWIKSDSSPAIGKCVAMRSTVIFFPKGGVVGESGQEPFLTLSDLINGTYNFTLVVTNSNGKKNEDNVTVTVKESEWKQLKLT